jgi:hypothetical protein
MPDQIANPADDQPTESATARRARFDLEQFRKFVRPLNWILFTASAVFFALLLLTCLLQHDSPGVWNLLLVAAGAAGGGGLLGFIYGSYGSDVTTRFGPVFSLLGGLLTGATLTDLSKKDSGITQALNSLATSCGINDAGGLMVAIIISFASVGFLLMYINLGLMLSPLTAQIIHATGHAGQTELLLSREIVKTVAIGGKDLGMPKAPTSVAKIAAQVLVGRRGAGKAGSPEKLLEDARVFTALGKPEMVEMALRNALKQRPTDALIQYELGLHLLYGLTGREAESIPYLQAAVRDGNTPVVAWKVLGFACLWDEASLGLAVDALHKYLEISPQDKDAKLSLAAAHARMKSPDNEQHKREVLAEVGELIKDDPVMRQKILDEAEDGDADDFKKWRNDPDFKRLLGQ